MLFILLLFLFFSCQKSSTVPNYYPIRVNNEWRYNSSRLGASFVSSSIVSNKTISFNNTLPNFYKINYIGDYTNYPNVVTDSFYAINNGYIYEGISYSIADTVVQFAYTLLSKTPAVGTSIINNTAGSIKVGGNPINTIYDTSTVIANDLSLQVNGITYQNVYKIYVSAWVNPPSTGLDPFPIYNQIFYLAPNIGVIQFQVYKFSLIQTKPPFVPIYIDTLTLRSAFIF